MSKRDLIIEPAGFSVTVDRVSYHEEVETPPDRPYCFVYFISIHNDTDRRITVKGRKWVVTNAEGKITAVEGEGVVGETPLIEPGHKFSYNSYHLLDTTEGFAEGSYIGLDEDGNPVLARIPKFKMSVPD